MPFVKIYYNKCLSINEITSISNSIHNSLITNFGVPKDDIFHLCLPYDEGSFIFNEHYNLTAHTFRSSKMVYIDILCGDGRSPAQKEKLFSDIANNITSCTKIELADIFITIKETPKENWSFGEGLSQLVNKEPTMNRRMPFSPTEEVEIQNPKLMKYMKEILFEEIWLDESLNSRERSLVTLAVLSTLGNVEQLDYHIKNAYKNGLSKDELLALTTHLTFYIGLPLSMQLLNKLVKD